MAEKQLPLQKKTSSKKHLRESAISGLTNDQHSLMLLMLHPISNFHSQPIQPSNLSFSSVMADSVERKETVKLINQLLAITSEYLCQPNKTSFIKFIKADCMRTPGGSDLGGFSLFLFIPGYATSSASDVQT